MWCLFGTVPHVIQVGSFNFMRILGRLPEQLSIVNCFAEHVNVIPESRVQYEFSVCVCVCQYIKANKHCSTEVNSSLEKKEKHHPTQNKVQV